RQKQVGADRRKRTRTERRPDQPIDVEARLSRVTTEVAEIFASEISQLLDPILMRAEQRAAAKKMGVRMDAKEELEPEESAIKAAVGKLRDLAGSILARLGITAEVGRVSGALNEFNADQIAKVLGVDVTSVSPDPAALAVFRRQTVELIKTIPSKQLDRVEALVTKAQTTGMRVETLRGRIQREHGVARRRAELIARDQVLTANADLHHQRQEAAGIERYEWDTSQDERVRPSHRRVHGETFSWDSAGAPGVGTGGGSAHPGEPINCRCVAIPLFD